MIIRNDDLTDPRTLDLLGLHLRGMSGTSPPGHSFALDAAGLVGPEVDFWSAWDGQALCGIGALRRLSASLGEIKSLRTHPDYLRRGVGRKILEHIVAVAGSRGLQRLSLETGTSGRFEPALALYRSLGFTEGEAFGDYVRSDFSRFFHLDLVTRAAE